MFANAWAWVKDHIWLTLGLLVGVVVLWRLSSGSGSGDQPVGMTPAVDPTLVQAGMQLQAQQAANTTQLQLAQTALQAHQEDNAAQISIAQIAADLRKYEVGAAAEVQGYQDNYAYQTTMQSSALAAAIASQQLQTQTQIAQMLSSRR